MEHVNDINIEWIDFEAKQALKSIDEISDFIQKHYDILKVNTVSFYTENQWEILHNFSPALSQELLQLTDEDVAKFPIGDPERFEASNYPALHSFCTSLPKKRIEQLGDKRENILGDGDRERYFEMSQSGKVLLKNFMAPKKTHEVLNMACFVNGMCKIGNVDQVVDIGSGKGYLSYFLSKYYHLNVIGIDSSCINTAGASKRNFMMDKQWRGLLKSAVKHTNNQNNITESGNTGNGLQSIDNSDGKECDDNIVGAVTPDQEKTSDGDCRSDVCNKKRMSSTRMQDQTELCCGNIVSQQETSVGHDDKCGNVSESHGQNKTRNRAQGASSNAFQPVTAYVNQRTDFSQFILEEKDICLVGLHACGDLSPSMLHIFTNSDHMKILCNVSCCYHLLTEGFPEPSDLEEATSTERNIPVIASEVDKLSGEEDKLCKTTEKMYLKAINDSPTDEVEDISKADNCCKVKDNFENAINPTLTEAVSLDPCCSENESFIEHHSSSRHLDGEEDAPSGFPMSSYLRSKQMQLNKNARMVGCMAVQRVYQAKELPTEKLFYRAVFQAILIDNFVIQIHRNVGKLAGKCKDFVQYCRRAFRKLGLDGSKLTDDQLLEYYNKYNPDKHKLQAFNQFRSALAPSIEGLILLDRLQYLKEQKNIKQAYIVKLFNQVISPRCYAIVAVKD